MSTNCVRCITNKRTGFDLLCDDCRELLEENKGISEIRTMLDDLERRIGELYDKTKKA